MPHPQRGPLRPANRHLVVALVLLGVAGLAVVAIPWTLSDPGPAGTDGVGYAVLGCIEIAGLCVLGAVVALILRAQARRRPPGDSPPPAWHPDPLGESRWRWWDGRKWTSSVTE